MCKYPQDKITRKRCTLNSFLFETLSFFLFFYCLNYSLAKLIFLLPFFSPFAACFFFLLRNFNLNNFLLQRNFFLLAFLFQAKDKNNERNQPQWIFLLYYGLFSFWIYIDFFYAVWIIKTTRILFFLFSIILYAREFLFWLLLLFENLLKINRSKHFVDGL